MEKLNNDGPEFVYIMQSTSGRLFKIGRAKDVPARLKKIGKDQIDLRNSFVLRVARSILAYRLERALHLAFGDWRVTRDDVVEILGPCGDGLSEWFDTDCLPRLEAYIQKNKDLFAHECISAETLIADADASKTKKRYARRAREPLYSNDELWKEACLQVDVIAANVCAVLAEAFAPSIKNFLGQARIYARFNPTKKALIERLIDKALDQGTVDIDNRRIKLVVCGAILPPAHDSPHDSQVYLRLEFPDGQEQETSDERIKLYFAAQLEGLYLVELPKSGKGWDEFYIEQEHAA